LHGALLARRGDLAGAERSLRCAIDLARSREARAWELRAATTLASMLNANGRRDEARSTLAPVHDSFTEGLDLPDLRDARDLLAALA